MKKIRFIYVLIILIVLCTLVVINSISKSNDTLKESNMDIYVDKYISNDSKDNYEVLYIYNMDESNLKFKYSLSNNHNILGTAKKSEDRYIYSSKDKKINFKFRDEYVKIVEYINNKESTSITLWKE